PDMRSRIVKLMPSLLDGKTVVLVTHDYATASALSDRVFYLSSPPVSLTEVMKNDIEGTLKQIENIDCEC
ncbi:MAG: hypothetical protein KAH21_01030, partial [Spirochaetaceae bacterium]|nr:hypothetical protein [Spirochaetaceae bacterium]